jgi:hypothetical protein
MPDSIRVNMSDKEASSVDREPLPSGKYHYKITDVELTYTKETAKHPNAPYLAFELTVQDGKYASRKDWTNAMCFDGALYTISQILKALGAPIDPNGGEVNIPISREFYVGKDIWGRRAPDRGQNAQKDEEGRPRIQLQGFAKYEGGESKPREPVAANAGPGASNSKASVLP